jgi:hypothetical protein
VSSVGSLRAGGVSRLPLALPRSGELTVQFVAEEERPRGIQLLTGPKPVSDVSLSVVSGNLGLGGRLVRTRPSGEDAFDLLDLGPGDRVLHYLATSGGEHSAGRIDGVGARVPMAHEMKWHWGTELRVRLPEDVVAAELTVLALDGPVVLRGPQRTLAVLGSRAHAGVFHVDLSSSSYPVVARWPGAARMSGTEATWTGLPPRATVVARLRGESGESYETRVELPSVPTVHSVAVLRSPSAMLFAVDEDGAPFRDELELDVSASAGDGPRVEARTFMRGGEIRLAASSTGRQYRVRLVGDGFFGEATVSLDPGAPVTVENAARDHALRRVVVATADGAPLAGATVEFGPRSGRTRHARTDANGVAVLPVPGEWLTTARAVTAEGSSEPTPLRGEETRLTVRPRLGLEVRFRRGMGVVTVRLAKTDRAAGPEQESGVRIFRCSIFEGSSLVWEDLRPASYVLEVLEGSEGSAVLFQEALDLGPSATAPLRVVVVP